LHEQLKDQFRYESLSVIEARLLTLGIDEVGEIELPNGKKLMIKPLVIDAGSALVGVDVPGLLQTDLRVQRGDLVVIGAESYRDGKLVIALEPDW
jgi:hypothetical protein